MSHFQYFHAIGLLCCYLVFIHHIIILYYKTVVSIEQHSLYLAGTALNLKTVFNALHSVSPKWSDIGLQLHVPISRLRIIEADTTGAEKRLEAMLDYWMKNAVDPLPSWEVLVSALKAPAVGESRLAKDLEDRHCRPEDQSSLGESEAL